MEEITTQYISEQMQALGLHQFDLARDLKIDASNINHYLAGRTNLSKAGKAMFYYYFEYKKLLNHT